MERKLVKKIQDRDISTAYGRVISILKNSNLTVGISTLDVGKSQRLVHEYSNEEIYVLSGSFELYCDNNLITLNENDHIFISRNIPYTIKNISDQRAKVIYIAYPLAPSKQSGHTYLGEENERND